MSPSGRQENESNEPTHKSKLVQKCLQDTKPVFCNASVFNPAQTTGYNSVQPLSFCKFCKISAIIVEKSANVIKTGTESTVFLFVYVFFTFNSLTKPNGCFRSKQLETEDN